MTKTSYCHVGLGNKTMLTLSLLSITYENFYILVEILLSILEVDMPDLISRATSWDSAG